MTATTSLIALCLLLATQFTSSAKVSLAPLFQTGMVLQRDMSVPVWGRATSQEKITVTFGGQARSTKANRHGHWQVELDPLAGSSEGREMKIRGKNEILLKDVVVGEVWICSGQSNMQMGAGGIPEIKTLIPKAKQLRTFEVPRTAAFTEQNHCGGQWQAAPPNSAVAFTFAHHLQQAADLPVGIILACWGSSSLEAWMPRDMTKTVPHFATIMEEFVRDKKTRATLQASLDKPKGWSRPEDIFIRRQPNILYNAMIKPLAPFACRGLVWYQGERNTQSMAGMATEPWYGRHSGILCYGDTLKKWIDRYRSEWRRKDMEFMIVMLPGFGKLLPSGPNTGPESPVAHSWAWMREQQLLALDLPHTTVINTIDLGDSKNIHPKDKLPIGKRLALSAVKNTLGQAVVADGPTFRKMISRGAELIVEFDHSDGLTTIDQNTPDAFWIADDSKQWFQAAARIADGKVVLSSSEVPLPKHIRYAFAGVPNVNLVNAAGLPARPFRTDSFEP